MPWKVAAFTGLLLMIISITTSFVMYVDEEVDGAHV